MILSITPSLPSLYLCHSLPLSYSSRFSFLSSLFQFLLSPCFVSPPPFLFSLSLPPLPPAVIHLPRAVHGHGLTHRRRLLNHDHVRPQRLTSTSILIQTQRLRYPRLSLLLSQRMPPSMSVHSKSMYGSPLIET